MADERLLEVLVQKVDGVADDVRTGPYRIDKLEVTIESRFNSLGVEIEKLTKAVRDLSDTVGTVSRQFAAVTSRVIEHDQRIESVENRIGGLETH